MEDRLGLSSERGGSKKRKRWYERGEESVSVYMRVYVGCRHSCI